jgi:hypothetical protein
LKKKKKNNNGSRRGRKDEFKSILGIKLRLPSQLVTKDGSSQRILASRRASFRKLSKKAKDREKRRKEEAKKWQQTPEYF